MCNFCLLNYKSLVLILKVLHIEMFFRSPFCLFSSMQGTEIQVTYFFYFDKLTEKLNEYSVVKVIELTKLCLIDII